MKLYITIILLFPTFLLSSQAPPAPEVGCEEVFKIVEEMPRFPGCENQNLSPRELEECSRSKLITYIYDNVEYPAEAKAEKVEGVPVIQFKILKDGSVADIKCVRKVDPRIDQAAENLVRKMQKDKIRWIPGKQRGRIVSVLYNLPIKFKLESKVEQQ